MKRNLFTSLLTGLFLWLFSGAYPAFSQSFLTNGLVASYTLDGNTQDSAGTHHGTAVDVSFTADRFGSQGRAVLLNGTSGYVGIPYSPDFDFQPTGQFSLAAWFKINGWGSGWDGVGSIVNKAPSTGEWDYGIDCPYRNEFRVWGGRHGLYACVSPNILQIGEWHHALLVYSNATWKLYEDGVVVSALNTTSPILQSLGGISIGRKGSSSQDYFKGAVDNVRVYDRALSASEAQQLYNIESQPPPCTPHRATATAQLVNGFVVGATVTDAGCGYTEAPMVLILGGGRRGRYSKCHRS